MTETAHALVAAAIARHTQNPAAAVTLSFLSHFVLDCIPHWDFGTNWRGRKKAYTGAVAIADVIIGYTAAFLLFGDMVPFPILFSAVTASMLPDFLEAPWYIFFASPKKTAPSKKAGFCERFTYGIYKIENQLHHKTTFAFGIVTQIAAVAFFLFLLK